MSIASTAKLALHGGEPIRPESRPWPQWPIVGEEERAALNAVFDSGNWFYGERVRAFEEAYAAFQGAKHCITCTSGTVSAEVAMMALGVGPGDEVLVPPYTFVATAMTVARVGATPIFVDVDESWCMDPDLIEGAITPRTKAIMPVHFGSRVADMDRINAIAAAHGLVVIEDACHSWGSQWKGKGTGALGRCGVFSFQQSKNLASAEGGCILTDDDALADRCRSITNCGRTKDGAWFEHSIIATNARMTEFQAALLGVQLTRLESQTTHRARMADRITVALEGIPGLTPQPGDSRMTRRAYHLYCLRLDPDAFGCSRAAVVAAATAEGLPLSTLYAVPLYKQPLCEHIPGHDYTQDYCPVTEDLCARSAISLHHRFLLGPEQDAQEIAAVFQRIHEHAHSLADLG